jgi:hypothetical protein
VPYSLARIIKKAAIAAFFIYSGNAPTAVQNRALFMFALLTSRTFALLLAALKCAAHMRGNKPGRDGNNRIANQDQHGGHNAPQRRMRRDIAVPHGRDGHNRPVDGRIERGKAIFRPFNQIHQRAKNNHHDGNKRIEQNQLMAGADDRTPEYAQRRHKAQQFKNTQYANRAHRPPGKDIIQADFRPQPHHIERQDGG